MPAQHDSREPQNQYRLFDFPVDNSWARKNNENLGEIRRLQVAGGVLAVACLVGAVLLVLLTGQAPLAVVVAVLLVLFALGFAAMIFYIPKKMGAIDETYKRSELVPGIVSSVHKHVLTITALVDQSVDRSKGSTPALATVSCQKLPGHEGKEGERVPCVAVVGNRSARGKANTYDFINPMPIAWGTPDASVIKRAIKSIPDAEWDLLRKNSGRFQEVQKTRTGILPL
ncbi:DUF3239 domain-containing protein [Dietzia sp.]|uniref:DUF3239 domain-containing protein n=1 Tax=Dietzia sp. TaxID=1871616 RepID=UPI002FD9D647